MSQPSGVEICIERLFDASPPLLFDAMTIPQHVRHWWECLDDKHSVTVCAIDLRVGAPGDLWDVAYPFREARDMVLVSGMEHGATISYDRIKERAMLMSARVPGVDCASAEHTCRRPKRNRNFNVPTPKLCVFGLGAVA